MIIINDNNASRSLQKSAFAGSIRKSAEKQSANERSSAMREKTCRVTESKWRHYMNTRQKNRPNILFYCTDQQRADLMGCMGNKIIKTPHFDALAERGALFRNCHVQGDGMHSRTSIMTGLYPSRHGVKNNGIDLSRNFPTMGDYFSEAGYHTGIVGRTHIQASLSHIHTPLPPKDYYGFHDCVHSQCYWDGLDPKGEYLNWIRREHPELYALAATTDHPKRTDAFCASWTTLDESLTMTSWVTDQSLAWIREHQNKQTDRPFFLWAGTWDPHLRFIVPSPWDRMYPPDDIPLPVRSEAELDLLPPHFTCLAMREFEGKKGAALDRVIQNSLSLYYGTISHIDDQFGRLLHGLDALGELNNTVIVLTSDHGEMLANHWQWQKGPFFFDDALRVPCIIAAPKYSSNATKSDALVETIDFLPTLMGLCDLKIPDTLQGKSFLSLIEGTSSTHRDDVFSELQYLDGDGEHMVSLRTADARITVYGNRAYGELYDLAKIRMPSKIAGMTANTNI
ncbi:MAG: sulfatase-like hydrolase/transferase [Victivallales bacterium]